MATKSRKNNVEQDQGVIDGIEKNLVGHTFVLGKRAYASQEVIAAFQARVDAGQAIIDARNALAAALKADAAERVRSGAFARGVRTILQGMFNETPDLMADFSMKPRKVTKKSLEVLARAVARAQATRAARGTMGKRQREAIKGEVPAEPKPAPTNGEATVVAPSGSIAPENGLAVSPSDAGATVPSGAAP
jgi:hypothetical protein